MIDIWEYYNKSVEGKNEWERKNSSFVRLNPQATYEQSKMYACNSIAKGLTNIAIKKGEILEISKGVPFHFLGRVDDSMSYELTPKNYYHSLLNSQFMACSTINNNNISHYQGKIFFLYSIQSSDIVHVFPMDSNTNPSAKTEKNLTWVPSLWLTFSELENVTYKIGAYNQVTCLTKRNNKMIKPIAVAAFDKIDDYTQEIADSFELGIVILHPNTNCLAYVGDILSDYYKFSEAKLEMKNMFNIEVDDFLFLN